MLQSFFNTERADKVVDFRVLDSFVDVVKLNIFVAIVTKYGFQTGNITKERRSGQAPEIEDGVFSFQRFKVQLIAKLIKCDQFSN